MTATRIVRYHAAAPLVVFLILLPTAASPRSPDTPDCLSALDNANRLMRGVEARQMRFSRHDPTENCRLLRDNLADLIAARDPLDRCLVGNERTKSLGQLDAGVDRVRAQLIANCRR